MKLLLRSLLLTLFTITLTSVNVFSQSATIATDKADYPPGGTVIITGTGFQPGEIVTLEVIHYEANGDNDTSPAHQPWTVTASVDGSVSTTWTVPFDEDELGATLKLTADGGSSGRHAEVEFTDNGNFSYANTNSNSDNLTTTAGTTNTSTLSVDVTAPKNNSTLTASLNFSVTSGTTIGIGTAVNQINLTSTSKIFNTGGSNGNNVTQTFPITATIGSNVPAGIYHFQTQAISNTGNPGNNKTWTFDITVGNTSGSIGTVAISNQSSNIIYGTDGNTDYQVTSTRGTTGTVNGTYSVTGLPTGVLSSFSVATFTENGSNDFPPTTLMLSVPNSINAGNYSFTVVLSDGSTQSTTTGYLVINKAASVTTVTITGSPFTYSGSAITPASVTVTGAGSLSLTPDPVYVNNINAGTANASYSYAGDANHEPSSDSKDFTIDKAPSVTTVIITGAPFTYTGSAITPASVTVTGAGGLSLTPTPVYANNTDAGTATASYSYTGDANHEASSDSKDFTIDKAPSVTTVIITGAPFTYTGSAITPASVTVTGAGGLSLTPTPVYANNTDAGTATASYSYTGDANHEASSDSKDFTIDKAPSVTTVIITGAPFTYTGSAITPASVTVTGAGGLSLTPTPVYANNTDAGTATASYSYTGDANHEASSDSKDFTIDKAPSVTTVIITGAPFTYTGSAITPASVTVTGAGGLSLTPTPVYANNTDAGTATASYSYTGDANHEASSDSKDFTIDKAPSVTTVIITGAPFTYTGSAITPASVTVTGAGGLSLTPTPVYANNTDAGTATASYSYTGDANHEASSDSKDFTIDKAPSVTTVIITGAPFTYTGSAITPASVTVTGAGSLSLTPDSCVCKQHQCRYCQCQLFLCRRRQP